MDDCGNVKIYRVCFEKSNAKLRRARRLYYRLISNEVETFPDSAYIYAARAQERGFFSSRTQYKSVVFAIYRGVYALSNFKDWGGFGWYRWLDDKQIKRWDVKFNSRIKPRLRVKAAFIKGDKNG